MATPGELVTVLAEDMGIPQATMAQYDRQLVVAGLRTKNGRGLSAANVTARDCAHLIVAALASPKVKNSVWAVHRYSETVLCDGSWKGCGMAELEALEDGHSFVDALEAMIIAAANRSLQEFIAAPAVDRETAECRVLYPLEYQVSISAGSPFTRGTFNIRSSRRFTVEYTLPAGSEHTRNIEFAFDLRHTSTISARTIEGVGLLLPASDDTAGADEIEAV